jgi:hypothetical protein
VSVIRESYVEGGDESAGQVWVCRGWFSVINWMVMCWVVMSMSMSDHHGRFIYQSTRNCPSRGGITTWRGGGSSYSESKQGTKEKRARRGEGFRSGSWVCSEMVRGLGGVISMPISISDQ